MLCLVLGTLLLSLYLKTFSALLIIGYETYSPRFNMLWCASTRRVVSGVRIYLFLFYFTGWKMYILLHVQ